MAQHIYSLDWFAHNEAVKYPIDSKATFIPTGYTFVPQELLGVITDISFNLPSSIKDIPYLAALTITDDLLSLIICAGTEPLFAFSSTQRSLYTNRYYTLTSFKDGCSGVIIFGGSAKTYRCSHKFADYTQAGFLPSVYHKYMDYPVASIGRKYGVSSYKKDIFFNGEGDVKVEASAIIVGNRSQGALIFSLNKPEETLQKYIGPADVRPESYNCHRSSIEQISCITPDESGNIAIEGDGININVEEGKLLLSTNYVLSDVCPKENAELFPDDECCDDCPHWEPETEDEKGCSGKAKLINFNQEVEGSGIVIDYRGLTTEESGEIPLVISKLSNILYFSIRVSWLAGIDDGYCRITYGDGQSVVTIRRTEVSWDRTYSLYDSDTSMYPNRVEVTIDRCNGSQSLWGDGKKITESNCNTSPFSANITFKGCTIAAIKYRDE